MCLLESWHVRRAPRHDRRHAPAREHEAGGRRDEGEGHAFGEQLTDDAPLSRAERRPYCDLPRARRAAREEQVRHVAACDEQHERDGREQNQEALPEIPDEALDERNGAEAHRFIILWKIATQARRNRVELGLRLPKGPSRLQSSVDGEVMLVVHRALFRCEGDRRPQLLAVARQIERLRHHARHDIGRAVHAESAAENRGFRAEAAHPQTMTQHYHPIAARPILFDRERSPQYRTDAQHLEVVGRHPRADDPFR